MRSNTWTCLAPDQVDLFLTLIIRGFLQAWARDLHVTTSPFRERPGFHVQPHHHHRPSGLAAKLAVIGLRRPRPARRAVHGLNALLCFGALIGVEAQAASPPATESNRFMVVSSQHLAAEAGAEILRAGGNAIDAAGAVGYAEGH